MAARHPASAQYAGFADFHLYRVTIERGHLVAGFGRIAWVEPAELRFTADASALVAAEAEIVAHMNRDHADAIELYAQRLLRRTGTGWRMTGIDPEGIDLRRPIEAGGEPARLNFAAPVLTPAMARPLASSTSNVGAAASLCPTVPVCSSPARILICAGFGGAVPSLHDAMMASASVMARERTAFMV